MDEAGSTREVITFSTQSVLAGDVKRLSEYVLNSDGLENNIFYHPHDLSVTLLQLAVSVNSIESVKWLLENGADPNYPLGTQPAGTIAETPLFRSPVQLALMPRRPEPSEAIDILRLLLAHGAEFRSSCALCWAVAWCHKDKLWWRVPLFLVEHGASPNTRCLVDSDVIDVPDDLRTQMVDVARRREESFVGATVFALQMSHSVSRRTVTQSSRAQRSSWSWCRKRPRRTRHYSTIREQRYVPSDVLGLIVEFAVPLLRPQPRKKFVRSVLKMRSRRQRQSAATS